MRVFIIHTLISLTHVSLSAQNQRLSIKSFNDNWGGGFTEIQDNYRSFGFLVEDEFMLFQKDAKAQLIYSGFTDKFSKDSTRIDELFFRANISIINIQDVLTFQVVGGFVATGDLGGQTLQNKIHGGVAVENTTLNYLGSNNFYGLFGGRMQGEFPLFQTKGAAPVFLAEGEYFLAPNYMQSVYGSFGFGFQNQWYDELKLEVGLNHQKAFEEATRQAAAEKERGIFISYKANLGIASFQYIIYPGGKLSIGMIGINLLNNKNRKELETVDFTAEFGALTHQQGIYQRYLWNKITRQQQHLQFEIHQQFWRINGSANPNFPDQYGHFQQISLGGNYSPITPNKKWQVLPFISARVGYKSEKIYRGETPQSQASVWSLNAIGEAGLRLKLPANFISKNCYYGGTASYSYAAPFYRNNDLFIADGYKFAQPIGAFSFGCFVMIDI